jgi:hypothetical protein
MVRLRDPHILDNEAIMEIDKLKEIAQKVETSRS